MLQCEGVGKASFSPRPLSCAEMGGIGGMGGGTELSLSLLGALG